MFVVSAVRYLWKNDIDDSGSVDQLPIGMKILEERLTNRCDMIREQIDDQRNDMLPVVVQGDPAVVRLVSWRENSRQQYRPGRRTEKHEWNEKSADQQLVEIFSIECVERGRERPEQTAPSMLTCVSSVRRTRPPRSNPNRPQSANDREVQSL
jgi:hypothetical protein